MTVRVVTDSACDVLTQLAQELGITVVPIYVVFGDESFRDRVALKEDELYDELVLNSVFPSTSVPSPNDFAEVHNKLADDKDENHLDTSSREWELPWGLTRGLVLWASQYVKRRGTTVPGMCPGI